MGCIRITIDLRDGSRRSGVRAFPEPVIMEDFRANAWLREHWARERLPM